MGQTVIASSRRAAGRPLDGTDLLRNVVVNDRYDDLAHELLIECLLEGGDVAAARSAHHARARAMAELDINIAPFLGG